MDAEFMMAQKMADSNGLRSRERPNEGMQVRQAHSSTLIAI